MGEIEALMPDVSYEELREATQSDRWLQNFLTSVWEKVHGKTVLTAYPWHQAYSLIDLCNASCAFCPCTYETTGIFDITRLPRLLEVMSFARTLILTGGECTIHPQFREILQEIAKVVDKRCHLSIISNGARLNRFMDEFKALNVNFSISLNAATPETHERVMKLGPNALPGILDSIRILRGMGKYLCASLVVNQQNLHEVPAFVALCHELNVNAIYIYTLNPLTGGEATTSLEAKYMDGFAAMPPYKHPEFESLRATAAKAIAASKLPIFADPTKWSTPVEMKKFDPALLKVKGETGVKPITLTKGERLSEEMWKLDAGFLDQGNPYQRSAPFSCNLLYFSLNILHLDMSVQGCCFIHQVPGFELNGFLASENFFEMWNAPAFVELRRSLQEGPLLPICKMCTYQMSY